MESLSPPDMDFHTAVALMQWQLEMGVDEAMGDAPLNRYDLPDRVAPAPKAAGSEISLPKRGAALDLPPPPPPVVPAAEAELAAKAAGSLAELAAAVEAFGHCELKKGARTTIFAEGDPAARVMVILDAPRRDEDMAGRVITGAAEVLLGRMLAAIGLSIGGPDPLAGAYLVPALPWRSPGDRDPEDEMAAMMRPFLARHVALAAPEVILCMGNAACGAVLERKGITRLRGHWASAFDRPVLATLSPQTLLMQPQTKAQAWADLLALRAKLGS
jgi:uracil-DNA glycosylase